MRHNMWTAPIPNRTRLRTLRAAEKQLSAEKQPIAEKLGIARILGIRPPASVQRYLTFFLFQTQNRHFNRCTTLETESCHLGSCYNDNLHASSGTPSCRYDNPRYRQRRQSTGPTYNFRPRMKAVSKINFTPVTPYRYYGEKCASKRDHITNIRNIHCTNGNTVGSRYITVGVTQYRTKHKRRNPALWSKYEPIKDIPYFEIWRNR